MTGLFVLIDQTIALHRARKADYEKAATGIHRMLLKLIDKEHESVTNISHRIKTESSLKEKILRRKSYKLYDTPEGILNNMSDCLGVMVECRFESDELGIYNELKEQFHLDVGNGCFGCEKVKNILFKMSDEQPQTQQNGNRIYRIDGVYAGEESNVVFELQIKSLVNKFWSDIEHSVIYKNNAYVPNNKYMVELLGSIHNNLLGMDKMLCTIKAQIETMSTPVSESIDIKTLLMRLFNDLINQKVSEYLGVFPRTQNVSKLLSAVALTLMTEDSLDFQKQLADLTMQIQNVTNSSIDLSADIRFTAELYPDRPIAGKLRSLADSDFEWHLFFLFYDKLLFTIDGKYKGLVEMLHHFIPEEQGDFSMDTVSSLVYNGVEV